MQDTNQMLVIAMLVQAFNQGKKRRYLEQQRQQLRIAQQARDEFQRCYNAHDKLLDEKDAEIERLLRKNRSLEDYVQDAAEEAILREDKIRDLENGHADECQLRMEAQTQLKEAKEELGRWRVAVAHERAWNGGNLRGKSAATEYERLNGRTGM